MSPLAPNILANFIGKVWTFAVGLFAVPFYLNFLGAEAYGLIGLYATIQSLFSFFDLGLGVTLTKELAQFTAQGTKQQEARDLVRTMEIVYWVIMAIMAVVVILLFPLLADYVVNAQRLSQDTVRVAVVMLGLAAALRFPFTLYSGGLMGLESQVLLNALSIGMGTLAALGAVLLLWLVSPTIQIFFLWQIGVSGLQTVLAGIFLWRRLGAGPNPRFNVAILAQTWRFAVGIGASSVLGFFKTLLERFVLLKLLSLEMFGYLSLATTVASGLFFLASPVHIAVFPRFSSLVIQGDQPGLNRLYHRACQIVSITVLPATLVIGLFAPEILLLWTRNPTTVEHTHVLVSILIVGSAAGVLSYVPTVLQYANGWSRLSLQLGIIGVPIAGLSNFLLTLAYGAIGASIASAVLSIVFTILAVHFMHTKLLKGEEGRWYFQDIGMPLLGAALVVGLGRWLFPGGEMPAPNLLVWILGISGLALCASVLGAPFTRQKLLAIAHSLRYRLA